MSDPDYLQPMKITYEMLESIHIRPVALYLNRVDDRDHSVLLMEGDSALKHGELEEAVGNLQKVYDSIPASEEIVKAHAQIILLEAQRCQRHAQPGE